MRRIWIASTTLVASTSAPPATCDTVLITMPVIGCGGSIIHCKPGEVGRKSQSELDHQQRQQQVRAGLRKMGDTAIAGQHANDQSSTAAQ